LKGQNHNEKAGKKPKSLQMTWSLNNLWRWIQWPVPLTAVSLSWKRLNKHCYN